MKAWILDRPGLVRSYPLRLVDVPDPEPGPGQVRIRVNACGICRTDLHVVEGELPPLRSPAIPGHQIVGTIDVRGPGAGRFQVGERTGVAWLHSTCGVCRYCRSGRENLCETAAFTGYTQNGGFAEFVLAREDFVYRLPDGFADLQAAPLLCAGIIGFRCLRVSGVDKGTRLGLYGFGAAAHVAIQAARHRGARVFVCTRDQRHQALARELGAEWAGGAAAEPPEKLDAAIVFAPAGELVPPALAALDRGGILTLGGIHMSDIPSLPYSLLYHERSVRTVANNTRQDGEEFLRVAAEIPIVPSVRRFPFEQANEALRALALDAIRGAAVLEVRRQPEHRH
jgi:propanol-preferring alcohol dehydrogenase